MEPQLRSATTVSRSTPRSSNRENRIKPALPLPEELNYNGKGKVVPVL